MKALTIKASCAGIELQITESERAGTAPQIIASLWHRKRGAFASTYLAFASADKDKVRFVSDKDRPTEIWVGSACFDISDRDAAKISETFGITRGFEKMEAA